ncbi:hypothetical protein O181_031056 [Austropuccinia psidii MF-1]|uniref:Uncharacterized protein n=1 Tax=Austropuccinia psidii MF-1 TaxID=1389203 RepID=A0A9Q3CU43_9BASI|nr:hypothetical protein [Austropuccinia psidii MF-1]
MKFYLHIKGFLGQEKTIELLGGWSPLSCKENFKKIKNLSKNRPEERTGNDPSLGERKTSSINQLQRSLKARPKDLRKKKVPRAIKEREKEKPIGTDITQKGTGFPSWNLQPWTVFNMARTLIEFKATEKERMNRTFPCK